MTVAEAEEGLRGAIREAVRCAEENRPAEMRATAAQLVELSIGRLVFAALQVGRPQLQGDIHV